MIALRFAIRRGSLALATAAAALVLLWMAGCSDDEPTRCEAALTAGRIEGTITSGGTPHGGWIEAIPLLDGNLLGGAYWGRSTSGSYSIDVPAGRYLVWLHPNGTEATYRFVRSGEEGGMWRDEGDTLLVDPHTSPVTANFDLGAIHLQYALDPAFDGQEALVVLARRSGSGTTTATRTWTEVRGGALDRQLPAIAPGSYKIVLYVGRQEERLWLPGVNDERDAWWHAVPAGITTEVQGGLPTTPATIEGEVLGAWKEFGLSPPDLEVYTADTGASIRSVAASASGGFGFRMLMPEPVKIQIVQDYYLDQWVGGDDFETAQVFVVEPGETLSGLRFLQCGVRVDLPPLSEAFRVALYDPADLSLVFEDERRDTYSSRVGIPNLRPGTYLLRIEPLSPGTQPWVAQWHDRADVPAEARPIVLANPGEVAAVSVVLKQGGKIRGSVLGLDWSNPWMSNLDLHVTPADGTVDWARVDLGEDPEFEILGLPDGLWKVGALDPDSAGRVLWFPGTDDWEQAEPIEIRDAGEVGDIVIDFADDFGKAIAMKPPGVARSSSIR